MTNLHRVFRFRRRLKDIFPNLTNEETEDLEQHDHELEDFVSNYVLSANDTGAAGYWIRDTNFGTATAHAAGTYLYPTFKPDTLQIDVGPDGNTQIVISDDGTPGLADLLIRSGDAIDLDPGSDLNISIGNDMNVRTGDDINMDALRDMNLQSERDVNIGPSGAGARALNLGPKVGFSQQTAATGPVGAIVGKVPVYDGLGVVLGYLPVYDGIT